jgi:hypothetical protein
MDIRQFAKKVRETAEALPLGRDHYMMSLDSDTKGTAAGSVVCMPRFEAGRGIVEQTHRLATPDEIDAHLADQKAKGDAIRQEDVERRFPLNLNVFAGHQGEKPKAERVVSTRRNNETTE